MARNAKIEVAAANIRISPPHPREYNSLLSLLYKSRRSIRVHGDTFLAITKFDPSTGYGIISKFTEIEIDGDWFDVNTFSVASPEEVGEINIPDSLRPNLAAFYFELNARLHVVAFEAYSDSRSLSLNYVNKYLEEVLRIPEVVAAFGSVEHDIVDDPVAAQGLLALPYLREIKAIIRRPNPDDIPESLAKVIKDRLLEQGANEYEEVIRSKGAGNLNPNDRTRALGALAAENGELEVKHVQNGVMVIKNSKNTPLIEVEKYPSDEPTRPHFRALAEKIFNKIDQFRSSLSVDS